MRTALAVSFGLVLGLTTFLYAPASAQAPVDEAKVADIRRLLVASGAGDLGVQVFNQMLAMFQQQYPEVPAELWESFKSEVNPDELVELVIPIYDKHLSHEDIKAAIAFYETPEGKNLIAALPSITQESMTAGQVWGQQIGEKVVQKLQASAPPTQGDASAAPAL